MRYLLIAFFFVVSIAAATTSRAGEIFYCADGRMLAIDSSNRKRLANDPCVIAWFAAEKAKTERVLTIDERRRAFLREPTLPYYRYWCPWRRHTVFVFTRY